MGTDILTFLALLPGIVIIIYVFRKDTVEKEPWSLIIKLLLFGALSCLPAAFVENYVTYLLPQFSPGTIAYAITEAFLVAALWEELFKFIFLKLGSWKNRNFDYRFDGVMYGVSVAVGFALLENLMYVATGGIGTALVRMVLAVPLHAFCGVFMGSFYSYSKLAEINGKPGAKAGFTLLALLAPMIIHGIYDSLAFMETNAASIALLVFVVIMYIVAVRHLKGMSKQDWQCGFYPHNRPLSQ